MKTIRKFLWTFIILLIVFIGILLIACSFPSEWIKDNVSESSKILNKEGNYKICFIATKLQFLEFDNYSDSLMINTAYSIDYKTPLYSAFTAKKDYIPGVTKKIETDRVGELKSNSKYDRHNEVGELDDTVHGIGEESFEYAKYWHGYLSILRPLLLVLNYGQIRVLLTAILTVLAIIVATEIAEHKSYIIASFYLLSLMCVEYFYIGLSLLNSIMFLIMMISSCILVKNFKKIKSFSVFFFTIGCCVGFFGLLDIPFITFGGPLILFFILKDGDGTGDIKNMLKFLVSWMIGYFCMWATKWILIDVIYHRNLIKTALGQILYRSVGGGISPIFAICLNVLNMAFPMAIVILLIYYCMLKYHGNVSKATRKKARIFIIISLLPFVWYVVLSNHSANHFFFAYRLLFITMFSYLLWVYYLCGNLDDKAQNNDH